MSESVEEKQRYKRNGRGRFVKGTAGGGRPKKKPVKTGEATLWCFKALRDAWLTFRIAQKYHAMDVLKCSKCRNTDLQMFDYQLAKGKLRARCRQCGHWNDFREKHTWYVEPLPSYLTREEAAIIAMQRKGTAPAPSWEGLE